MSPAITRAGIAFMLTCWLALALAGGGNHDETARAEDQGDRSYFQDRGYVNLGVTREDLPRRGQCRVWYPGRPAGEQPEPGKCKIVSRQVPPGAWLLARPMADPAHVTVQVYDPQLPGVVTAIGVFSVETRRFVRYMNR